MERPGRCRGRHRLGLVALLALVLSGTVGACESSPGIDGDASCAAVIELDGHTYQGRGGLERTPATTGQTLPAVLPGCDDTGGQDAAEDEPVEVQVLEDVEPSVAVLLHETVYVRDGAELPEAARAWFRPEDCATSGDFELTADWLGVKSPRKVRFDGDIRRPYRMMVRVTEGPSSYVGTRVTLHATASGPRLSPGDVKRSLWEGGYVVATVRCSDGAFELVDVRALPPA